MQEILSAYGRRPGQALVGVEDLRPTITGQGLVDRVEAESTSMVTDTRQASTPRLNQSITAARYT